MISPLLDAAAARVVVEIGVGHGSTTQLLLERAKRLEGSVVHAIDPAPAPGLDLEAWARDEGSRLRFHRGRSHQLLPQIEAVDAVLLDGDHNWYTVTGELRILAAVAADRSVPLPLVLAHDVGWPYGRRDMYYDLESIPRESRQEAARSGLEPGRSELTSEGINHWLWNATEEGGPRNGVLTAIEDFAADYDVRTELTVLEGFHGLGVLASDHRIEASPNLRSALARLDSPEFNHEWAVAMERARVDAEMLAWRALGKPAPPATEIDRREPPPA